MSFLLMFLAGCAKPQPLPIVAPVVEGPRAPYTADVRLNEGVWEIAYRFAEPQSALLFDTSHQGYRTSHWEPGEGVTLENHGGLDLMLLDPPATEAHFSVSAPEKATEGTAAFLLFSDGSEAFYTGQLALLTVGSRDEAVALDGNLRNWTGEQPPVDVAVSSDARLVGPAGEAATVHVVAHNGTGPYVYSGTLPAEDGRIVDPGLPEPLQKVFTTSMPVLRASLEARWGEPIPEPALWLAWGGGEGDLLNRGRAEGRQITMAVQGSPYLAPEPDLQPLVWFFAHELTHHHQQAHSARWPMWMGEGLADLSATEALVGMGMYDQQALERRYWGVARECARELVRGPVSQRRGRVAYVCGDLAGLAILGMLSDGDLPGLWKELAAEEVVDTDVLIVALERRGADEAGLQALRAFLDETHTDSDAAIRELFEAAGLAPVYVEGSLSSMAFPFVDLGEAD